MRASYLIYQIFTDKIGATDYNDIADRAINNFKLN